MIPTIKVHKTNATSVTFSRINKTTKIEDSFTLFYSYETCVAFEVKIGEFHYSYQTNKRYSNTTSRHKTLMGVSLALEVDEAKFQDLLEKELKQFL